MAKLQTPRALRKPEFNSPYEAVGLGNRRLPNGAASHINDKLPAGRQARHAPCRQSGRQRNAATCTTR